MEGKMYFDATIYGDTVTIQCKTRWNVQFQAFGNLGRDRRFGFFIVRQSWFALVFFAGRIWPMSEKTEPDLKMN